MLFVNEYMKNEGMRKEERKLPFSYICKTIDEFLAERENIKATPFWHRSMWATPLGEVGSAKVFISNINVENIETLRRYVVLEDRDREYRIVVKNQTGHPLTRITQGPQEVANGTYDNALINYFPWSGRMELISLEKR